jgi:hypothetical protein
MSRTSIPRGLALLALLCASAGQAQVSDPPKGPADIMNQANAGRQKAEVERAAQTADEAAAKSAGAAPDDHDHGGAGANNPHGRDPNAVLAPPALPSAEPKLGAPPGSIDIEVVGPTGAPQAGAEIVLGIMASMGGRTEQRAKTDAQGRYTFGGLGVGTQQAYRVNVLHQGGKFSTTPFRLPEESGYAVRMPLRATTTDNSLLFQVIGQTMVELRDDRLHITQQAKLANAGERVIVLPKEGLTVPLPEGFTAFQFQEQMTDQRGEELAGKGFRLRGSLPPGSVTLAWTYDLPRAGESAKIAVNQPWRTYTYRVISEAPAGLKLRVSDFPEPERVKDQQRELLFTELQRSPRDIQLGAFTIKLEGIPGPGPGRWFAVALALLAVGLGLARAFKAGDDAGERKAALAARKQQLIALAKSTESEHQRGDIGPQYRAERLEEILTELALVLRDEEALTKTSKTGAPKTSASAA